MDFQVVRNVKLCRNGFCRYTAAEVRLKENRSPQLSVEIRAKVIYLMLSWFDEWGRNASSWTYVNMSPLSTHLPWTFLPIALFDYQNSEKAGWCNHWPSSVLRSIANSFHWYIASIYIYAKMRNSILNILNCFSKLVSCCFSCKIKICEQSQHKKAVEYDTFLFFFPR